MAHRASFRSTASRRRHLATTSTWIAALACVAVAGTRPAVAQAATTADSTLTLRLVGGGLDLRVDGISTLASGDGSTTFDAVLEVDDATGSGGGWVITLDGPSQAVQVLAEQASCPAQASCVPARAGSPGDGDTSHLLVAAQPDSGMGPQRVEVVFRTAAAGRAQWSFSVAPRI
jgi:hypothetical protein